MTNKYTPGPWEAEGFNIRVNDQLCYTLRNKAETQISAHELRANTYLLAAAPDLLEALQLFVQFFDEMPKGQLGNIVCDIGLLNDSFIKSSKAIKKALSDEAN